MDRRTRPCYTGSMHTSISVPRGARRMGSALLALFFVMAGQMPVLAATPEATATETPRREDHTASPQTAPATQNSQDGAIVIHNDAPGYDGYAGTWRDPENGDIVTSVIAPRRPREQTQQQPIYIAPQIDPQWPGNGYGNSGWNNGWPNGWNGGWQSGGNNGWPNGWNGGAQPGWGQSWRPGPPPGNNSGWGQSWRPGAAQTPPGAARPPSAMTPPAPPPSGMPAQPGVRPPQRPERPGPGGLTLPDMQPGMQAPQGGSVPPAPGNPPGSAQPGNWQGTSPGWRPSGWQTGAWQPAWQQSAVQPGAWRPWGPVGTGSGVKAWTPGQPPHGNWQPLSWSPGPAGAWNPWQPYGMRGAMMGGMNPGMRPRLLGMPQLPPNITRHLGPVIPFNHRGGPR